jgi:hypothetical protein
MFRDGKGWFAEGGIGWVKGAALLEECDCVDRPEETEEEEEEEEVDTEGGRWIEGGLCGG